MSAPVNKEFHTRYFTYYLHFPKDKDFWVAQTPFIHDLQYELTRSKFKPDIKAALAKNGEAHWKDHNGIIHRVVIEDVQRPRRWGKYGNK